MEHLNFSHFIIEWLMLENLFTENNRRWTNEMHVLECNDYCKCAPTGWRVEKSLGSLTHFNFYGIDNSTKKNHFFDVSLINKLRCVVCIHLITLAGKCCIDRIKLAWATDVTLNIIFSKTRIVYFIQCTTMKAKRILWFYCFRLN